MTHLRFVCLNTTTIESLEIKPRLRKGAIKGNNPYDLGMKNNFKQVFGDKPLLWFLPIASTKGNGLSFPTRESLLGIDYDQIDDV